MILDLTAHAVSSPTFQSQPVFAWTEGRISTLAKLVRMGTYSTLRTTQGLRFRFYYHETSETVTCQYF